MKYQNYIFQSLIYLLATIFILLTIGKDANLTDFYWTRITVFIVMTANALLGIIYYSRVLIKKKEKPTIMMTIDFLAKAIYIVSFIIFCTIE